MRLASPFSGWVLDGSALSAGLGIPRGAPSFGFGGVSMATFLPPEPPHWGADETSGLLERVAGENATLPCPARGEAGPWVGWAGDKTHPHPAPWVTRCGQRPWVWSYGVPSPVRGHAEHFVPSQPDRMGISISSFFKLGAV